MRAATLGLFILLAGCGDGGTASGPSLPGTWTIARFVDAGVPGVTTGTMTFLPAGTFSARGTVTYPGEPQDSIVTDGTWVQHGTQLDLTVAGNTSPWQVSGSADSVELTLMGPAPTNAITLLR